MPAYINRPPIEPSTAVWRYLSLKAAVATVRDRKLRLTRLDTFPDPFEGSVPKQQIEDQLPLAAGATTTRSMMSSIAAHYPSMSVVRHTEQIDLFEELTRLRRAKTRSTYASCWSAGNESEALWRLYGNVGGGDGIGVALKTTLSRLEASVQVHDLYVSPVSYRPYHEGPAFTDEIDSLMHKRLGFQAEQEVRLLKVDHQQYLSLTERQPNVPELPEHVFLAWPVEDIVEEIVLSPYADADYEWLATTALTAAMPGKKMPVTLSDLNPRRYQPNF